MHILLRSFLFLAALFAFQGKATAAVECTLLLDNATAEIIRESGDCKTRRGAESTFKIPLALMGFDSGILKDAHTPSWDYDPAYNATRAEEKHATDPARWEKDSVVWYSQKLTRTLGMDTFKRYVESFRYGNMDVTGDPGKNNGLTHAWLSSSLKISPLEQVSFLRKMLGRRLGVSDHAYDMTLSIIPQFGAGGWKIHGKTGSGFHRDKDGVTDRALQRGWFVGWAEKDGREIIFAKFIADDKKTEGYAGPRARDAFLKDFPALMANDARAQH